MSTASRLQWQRHCPSTKLTMHTLPAFDHFCSVTAANYHINTGQTFTSGDYFCKDDWAPDVCIVLQVKYTCGLDVAPADVNVKSTVSVDYNGCMVRGDRLLIG